MCRSWFSLRFSLLKTLPTVRCTFLRGHGRGRDTTHGERNSCLLSFSKQQGACSTLWPPRSLLTYAVHTQLTEVIKPSYATVTQFPIKYWVLYLKSEHVQNIFIFRVNDHFRELHYLRGLLQKNKCKSVILGWESSNSCLYMHKYFALETWLQIAGKAFSEAKTPRNKDFSLFKTCFKWSYISLFILLDSINIAAIFRSAAIQVIPVNHWLRL